MPNGNYVRILKNPIAFLRNRLLKQVKKAQRSLSSLSSPYTEISRSASEVTIQMKLPGIAKNCTVNVVGTELEITAETSDETIYRKINLPQKAILDKISASRKHQVLLITIPVKNYE